MLGTGITPVTAEDTVKEYEVRILHQEQEVTRVLAIAKLPVLQVKDRLLRLIADKVYKHFELPSDSGHSYGFEVVRKPYGADVVGILRSEGPQSPAYGTNIRLVVFRSYRAPVVSATIIDGRGSVKTDKDTTVQIIVEGTNVTHEKHFQKGSEIPKSTRIMQWIYDSVKRLQVDVDILVRYELEEKAGRKVWTYRLFPKRGKICSIICYLPIFSRTDFVL
eukprot:GHVU01161658.1.p1 GENE.GHVU01161658.1~~GHVU01161658.1.p1  ORF type:complete len:220 (-),score=9.88 GHVU01161658.1:791-1450(-)